MDSTAKGKELLETMVKAIVDKPDEVVIESSLDEKGIFLQIRVNSADLGRVIGKGGETAQAMRYFLRALGVKHDARYSIKVVDHA